MRKLQPVVVGFLAGALVCAVFFISLYVRASPAAQPAPAGTAPLPRVNNEIVVMAEALPVTSAELSLAATGVVSEVLVSEGDTVKKGQLLVRLDATRQVVTVREEQALLDRARFDHAAAQTTLTKTQAVLSSLQTGTAPEILNGAQADVALADANAQSTDSGVTTAAAALQRAQARLAATELHAPFDGTVVSVNVKPGETSPAGSFAVRLADLSQWEIQTKDLTELSVSRVKVGDPAVIKFDAIQDLC